MPDLTAMGFYHDDFPISQGLLEPPSTLPAILGILALTLGAVLLRRRNPVVAFGILFFLIGHSMESTIIALELIYEHRNYVPSFGPLLGFAYYC